MDRDVSTTKSDFERYFTAIKYRVYLTSMVRESCGLDYGILKESSWQISNELNEWLTINCRGRWGLFQEFYLIYPSVRAAYIYIEFFIKHCKPFIGFENKDDALMFKLSC